VLDVLQERGVEFDVVEYLKAPLDRETLSGLVELVGGDPVQMVRTSDRRFKDGDLSLAPDAGLPEVVDLLLDEPAVMQRPVVVSGKRAVIARPSDRVLELL
jgi:arsenate reductase